MLRALGGIFYGLAGFSVLAALILLSESGPLAMVAIASAVSSAFFGAMCFAAEEALTLLRRIAGISSSPTSSSSGPFSLGQSIPVQRLLIAILLSIIAVILFAAGLHHESL